MATLSPGPYFKPTWFVDKINDLGVKVAWQKAVPCSCISMESNQPNPSCPLCGGTGFVYQDPVEIKVLAISITTIPEYMLSGLAQFGELLVTVNKDIDMSTFDRLVFLEATTEIMHLVIRNPNTDTDRIKYELLEPEYVFYNGIYYSPNTDFTYNGKEITWIGNRPPDGVRYSMRYKTHPAYLISKVLHETRATEMLSLGNRVYKELPQQYLARREVGFEVVV